MEARVLKLSLRLSLSCEIGNSLAPEGTLEHCVALFGTVGRCRHCRALLGTVYGIGEHCMALYGSAHHW